jgi:hypothetical protein
MRSLWIASAECSEFNESCLSLEVVAHFIDLHAQPHFYWLIEVVTPKVLQFINRKWAHHFKAANAPMAFAPANWRKFYRDRGWEPLEFEEMSPELCRSARAEF